MSCLQVKTPGGVSVLWEEIVVICSRPIVCASSTIKAPDMLQNTTSHFNGKSAHCLKQPMSTFSRRCLQSAGQQLTVLGSADS